MYFSNQKLQMMLLLSGSPTATRFNNCLEY